MEKGLLNKKFNNFFCLSIFVLPSTPFLKRVRNFLYAFLSSNCRKYIRNSLSKFFHGTSASATVPCRKRGFDYELFLPRIFLLGSSRDTFIIKVTITFFKLLLVKIKIMECTLIIIKINVQVWFKCISGGIYKSSF